MGRNHEGHRFEAGAGRAVGVVGTGLGIDVLPIDQRVMHVVDDAPGSGGVQCLYLFLHLGGYQGTHLGVPVAMHVHDQHAGRELDQGGSVRVEQVAGHRV